MISKVIQLTNKSRKEDEKTDYVYV